LQIVTVEHILKIGANHASHRRNDKRAYLLVRPGSDKPLEKITFYTRVGDQDWGVGYYKE
jgi:hypothetical protein